MMSFEGGFKLAPLPPKKKIKKLRYTPARDGVEGF